MKSCLGQPGIITWGYTSTIEGCMIGHLIHTVFTREEESVYVLDVLFCEHVGTLYIIDICELHESTLFPYNTQVFDIQSFQEHELYSEEFIETIKDGLMAMYPTYTTVQIYTKQSFQDCVLRYTQEHYVNVYSIFGDVLPYDACYMISLLSLPSWCNFQWDQYIQNSTVHMKWGRRDIPHRMITIQQVCHSLFKKLCMLPDIHTFISYHTPKRNMRISFTAPLDDYITYNIGS